MPQRLTPAAVLIAWIAGLSCSALCGATPARAQGVPAESFAIQRFSPAPGPGNFLMVDGTAVGKHLAITLGVLADYAHRPFVLRAATCAGGNPNDCSVHGAKVDIVSYQLTFDAMATLTLFDQLQLGLVVPVIASGGEPFVAPTANDQVISIAGGDALGLGDPRLSAKVRLTGPGADLGLALIAFATAPLGELTAEGHRLGDDGITAGGQLAVELGLPNLRFGLNAGARYRPHRQLLSTEVGSELIWGAAVALHLTPLLRVIGEITGANRFSTQLDESPIEARAAAELSTGDFALLLGGGTGLVGGVGVPDLRVMAGIGFRPQGLDTDGDGVADKTDACPAEHEDLDGYQDSDGCPDGDNDDDGILDASDRCRDQPEDKDGNHDEDGCPDVDDDGDGIEDGYDSCPAQAEDKDGDRDEDGCPEDDRDRDGVADAADKCPDAPEDTDGLGDEDGCPETDFDGDTVPDDEDQCADKAEDPDGYQDEDGCPEDNPPPPPPPPRRRGRR